jgi:hypothetical protein
MPSTVEAILPAPAYECRRWAPQDQLTTNPAFASLHSRPTRPMHKMDYAIASPRNG